VRNKIILVLLLSAGGYGYSQYQRRTHIPLVVVAPAPLKSAPESQFKCDGRIYCSQMTSCAEATYFLKNCPGTKMDGDNDGIPCEQQWCN
jgi:hypothetical protein